jgi:hypothetical protein
MPTMKRTGASDTDSVDEHVTSARVAPTTDDLRGGRAIPATVPVEPRPTPAPPLVLADEPRFEEYELMAPGGVVVEVRRNLDTGEQWLSWTNRTQLAT